MNQLKSLVWKEWLEIRGFFLVALFVFLGLPLLGGIESLLQTGRFEILASVWTYFLGGVLAIFVGVGTVIRDLKGRLEDFWRSRPVKLNEWLFAKYFVGLAVVIVTLAVPLVLELLINQTRGDLYAAPQFVLAWHPFLWAAMYSVGFLTACLLRRGAHAAMLSLAVMLLFYFLPEILPPLRHLGVSWAVQESQFPRRDGNYNLLPEYHAVPWVLGKAVFHWVQFEFVAGMVVLCAIAAWASLVVIRRDKRLESDRRTIYWSIGGALLILFASTSFQLATNLELLQTVKLPNAQERVVTVQFGQDGGVLFTNRWRQLDGQHSETIVTAYPFRITRAGVELQPVISLPSSISTRNLAWRPQHPDVIYTPDYVTSHPNPNDATEHLDYPKLTVCSLAAPTASVSEMNFKDLEAKDWGSMRLYVAGDLLYFLGGPHVLTFDIADPLRPRLLSHRMIPHTSLHDTWSGEYGDSDTMLFALPEIAELSPQQRLEARMAMWQTFDGRNVYRVSESRIMVFSLDELTPTTARFRKSGRYDRYSSYLPAMTMTFVPRAGTFTSSAPATLAPESA